MSEWIDHAAIADSRLAAALPWLSSAGRSDLGQVANILAAQAHATLALAEQQRIANIIALAAMDPDSSGRSPYPDGLSSSAYSALAAMSSDRRHTILDPNIAAALGIGDDDE